MLFTYFPYCTCKDHPRIITRLTYSHKLSDSKNGNRLGVYFEKHSTSCTMDQVNKYIVGRLHVYLEALVGPATAFN